MRSRPAVLYWAHFCWMSSPLYKERIQYILFDVISAWTASAMNCNICWSAKWLWIIFVILYYIVCIVILCCCPLVNWNKTLVAAVNAMMHIKGLCCSLCLLARIFGSLKPVNADLRSVLGKAPHAAFLNKKVGKPYDMTDARLGVWAPGLGEEVVVGVVDGSLSSKVVSWWLLYAAFSKHTPISHHFVLQCSDLSLTYRQLEGFGFANCIGRQ